jgi:hypothetical protein
LVSAFPAAGKRVARIRLIRKLAPQLNGVDLSGVKIGDRFVVDDRVAAMLIQEAWAEPVLDDAVSNGRVRAGGSGAKPVARRRPSEDGA